MIAQLEDFTAEALAYWLEALVCTGTLDMRRARERGEPLPRLYGGAIRYQREPPHSERWNSAVEVARLGYGDCEDLAAYRAAELRLGGQWAARAILIRKSPTLLHCVVDINGQREDPSKRLGM